MAGLMRILVLALLALLIASPAEAGPVIGAIQAVATALQAFAATSLFASFLVQTGLSIGFSLLAQAVRGKPRAQGITADTTTTGGTTPWTFGVGLFATGGQLIAPPNSHGAVGDTPRAYLVYPLALSVVPGCALNRLIVNDAYVPLAALPSATWGREVTGDLAGFVQVDYQDGSQTAAQPDMLAAFGSDPDRPWSADMVGPGTCMAYARFRYSRRRFNGLPSVRFEMLGIPLYDPRADSSVGGSGPQRWDDRTTWAWSANAMVIIYNILRGIDVGAGLIWGGETAAEDLPLADWFAAMNECDLAIDDGDGGTEPQYRCGMQISVDDEPASVIEELLKACAGQLVEIGGVWYPHVGAPALPSYWFTDEDILITAEQSYDPHPGLSDTYNGITAAYPDPDGLWEAKDAPPRYNTEWEAEDGGRRLVADLELRACSWAGQVQRIMAQIIADHRRMRRHQHVMPPEAVTLRPFQTVGWTSARHGYTSKVFEITGVTDQLMTLNQGLALRERDSGDFAWDPETDLIPVAPAAPVTTPIPAQALPGWAVAAASIVDAASTARRPAITASWTAAGVQDARGVRIAIRLAGDAGNGRELPMQDAETGSAVIADGILPATNYQLRALPVLDRDATWTGWTAVTTPNVGVAVADLSSAVLTYMETTARLAGFTVVSTLPASGALNQIVMLIPPGQLYRWDGSAWVTAIYAGIPDGALDIAKFAASLAVPVIWTGGILPTTRQGSDLLFWTVNDKLYRWNGTAYTTSVDGVDLLADSVTAGKVAAAAIGTRELAAKAATIDKLLIANPSNLVPNGNFDDTASATWGAIWGPASLSGGGAVNGSSWARLFKTTNSTYTDTGVAAMLLQKSVADLALSVYTETLPAQDIPIEGGKTYYCETAIRTNNAGGAVAGAYVRVYWLDASKAQVGYSDICQNAAIPTSWTKHNNTFTPPADACYARVRIINHSTNTTIQNLFVDRIIIKRKDGATLIDEDGITTPMIKAGAVITALLDVEWLIGERLQAAFLDINTLLTIQAMAGLSYNKPSVASDVDGLYFGRDGTNFGFAASRTNGSKKQSLRLSSSTGLALLNARHWVTAASVPADVTRTTNLAKTALPAGIKTISLTAIGGGAAGWSVTSPPATANAETAPTSAGGAGANTVVKLYDGTTLMHTFTAPGASNAGIGKGSQATSGSKGYGKGEASVFGNGGVAGYYDAGSMSGHAATAATGKGAGGGAGVTRFDPGVTPVYTTPIYARGGLAATPLPVDAIDVSSWASPQIEITIGAGGTAPASSEPYGQGGAGAPGQVVYSYTTGVDTPADVVPLVPTTTGSFAKAASTAGSFPALGAGLWIIDTGAAETNMQLGDVTIAPGKTIRVSINSMVAFFSSQTPSYTGGPNARTIYYQHFSMGGWG
jgi:hypothetical protein